MIDGLEARCYNPYQGVSSMIRFEKHLSNPIYGDSCTGTIFDVYVTKETERFRMDFSWRRKKALGVSFSPDGYSWDSPRISLPAVPESPWEADANRNCVLSEGGLWKMWYTGQARGRSCIGYAESPDGLSFTRIREEPVLMPETDFEGESVMNPCVLRIGEVYRMWYAAGETYEPNVLCCADSPDGIFWTKKEGNPIFTCDPRHVYEQERVGGCQVLPHSELGYLMFYIGYRDINTACICAAASHDGVTEWKRFRGNPLVTPDPGAWDGEACYKPSALFDSGRNLWRIWYNGRRGSEEYIGVAEGYGDFAQEDFE